MAQRSPWARALAAAALLLSLASPCRAQAAGHPAPAEHGSPALASTLMPAQIDTAALPAAALPARVPPPGPQAPLLLAFEALASETCVAQCTLRVRTRSCTGGGGNATSAAAPLARWNNVLLPAGGGAGVEAAAVLACPAACRRGPQEVAIWRGEGCPATPSLVAPATPASLALAMAASGGGAAAAADPSPALVRLGGGRPLLHASESSFCSERGAPAAPAGPCSKRGSLGLRAAVAVAAWVAAAPAAALALLVALRRRRAVGGS